MIIAGVTVIAVFCILGFIISTLNTRIVDLNRRVHNVEVECFSPLAEVSINGEKKNRLTLCGAVKPIFDLMSAKNKKPRIIFPTGVHR